MTRVALGCPTTRCDKTVVRSSTGSAACFLARLWELRGFSIPLSDLIIAGEVDLPRLRRRSWGGSDSFIEVPYELMNGNLAKHRPGNQIEHQPNTSLLHCLVSRQGQPEGVDSHAK